MAYRKFIPPSLYDIQELQSFGLLRLVLQALCTGILSGLIIGLFRMAYTAFNTGLGLAFRFCWDTWEGMLGTAAALLFFALVAWSMVCHEPLISGSGIPHVELVIRGRLPMPWWRILWTKFFGTLASLSGGLAVGREGPCIQMGAAVGCGVGAFWHDDYLRPRFLVGGSTAGMAAAFGAPLAGMFFAFEEMRTLVTPPMLIFTGIAATGAWFIVDIVLKLGLVFPLHPSPLTLSLLWMVPLAAISCGLLAIFYNKLLVTLVLLTDRSGIRQPFRLLLAFVASGLLLYLFPAVITGLGPGIPELEKGLLPLEFLLFLWAIKLVFNCVSFASGVSGGILMPMLISGGMTGALLGAVCQELAIPGADTTFLLILGMGCFFAGTVRAPLTGAFLITEMTGAWALLPTLAAGCFIASLTANAFRSVPVYDSLRARQLNNYLKAHPEEKEGTLHNSN